MIIKAIIPARSGSERVKNKNIRPFAGSSLLEIKIRQMQRIQSLGFINGVVVNSNCDEILQIAEKCGVECVKRDERYATAESRINEVYANIAECFDGEVMLYVDCTNPLLEDRSIIDAIEIYKNKEDKYDSVNTFHIVQEFLWREEHDDIYLPINYDPLKMPRSQDLQKYYAFNCAINIIPKKLVEQRGQVIGSNPYLLCLNEYEALDIDNQIDFDFAEFLYRTRRK